MSAAAGCGLIDSDVTHFNLTLPAKQFTIDSGRWGLTNADQLVRQTCTTSPDPCATAAQAVCTAGMCSAECNATTRTCDLTLMASIHNLIDLQTEKPELAAIRDQPIIDVTIDAIKFDVSSNTMNIATPEMVIYSAPTSVTTTPNDLAKRVGTVPPIPAMTTPSAHSIAFDPMGSTNLAGFMSDYRTSFNVIVASEILIESGDPVPTGAITMRVIIEAHAGL